MAKAQAKALKTEKAVSAERRPQSSTKEDPLVTHLPAQDPEALEVAQKPSQEHFQEQQG